MYTYQCLACQSYTEIADCLNLAFSDYALPVQLSAEQVEAFFASSGADLRLSFGAFYDNRLIGFMVNACSIYNEERAVFDVATGVVPEHRGKKVFTNLFSFAGIDEHVQFYIFLPVKSREISAQREKMRFLPKTGRRIGPNQTSSQGILCPFGVPREHAEPGGHEKSGSLRLA